MSARSSLLHPCRLPRVRGLLAGAAGAAALTLSLALGTAVAAPSSAQAAMFCGAYESKTVQTKTRYSRVRARACLDMNGTSVRGYAESVIDSPIRCRDVLGIPICDPRAFAQFHGFELRVVFSGKTIPCKFPGVNKLVGASGKYRCNAPPRFVSRGGTVGVKAQMCYDAKDDGQNNLCTDPVSFSRVAG